MDTERKTEPIKAEEMKKITAADLLRLDFKRVDVLKEEGWDEDFFYFTFNLKSKYGYPLLITGVEDNKNDEYCVEINELEDNIIIKDLTDLESLVDIMKRNLNNE